VPGELKEILVPFDGSDNACEAARFAAQLAKATGASLHLCHVMDESPFMMLGATALSADELRHAQEQISRRAFERVMELPEVERLKPSTDVSMGKPSEQIVRYARNRDIDLIVMGSRGLSGFQELLLGSVSAQVIEHAPCSVTIVR
jgi:nucleotide-binding universal stress UspA family protein